MLARALAHSFRDALYKRYNEHPNQSGVMRLTAIHRNFGRDQRGSAGAMFGLLLIPAVGVIGLAIDMGRVMNERTRLQAAADIAALNGAKSTNTNDAERSAAASVSLSANGIDTAPTTALDQAQWCAANSVATCATSNTEYAAYVAGVSAANAALPTITATNGLVTVTASGSVKSTFAQLFGVPSFDFSVESKATAASGKQLELAMMVDLTGSMGGYRNGQTKIAALKDAADDLLGIVMPGNANPTNVRVAIAPFSDYVNAGPYAGVATGMPTSGTYAPISNMKRTRQGKTNHVRYTGVTGNSSGSQAGATSSSGVLNAAGAAAPSSNNGNGGSFANGYCADPTSPSTPVAEAQHSGKPVGFRLTDGVDGSPTAPPELKAAPTDGYYRINVYDNAYGQDRGWEYYSDTIPWDSDVDESEEPDLRTSGYYIPIPATTTGVTYKRHSNGKLIGVRIGIRVPGAIYTPSQFKNASAEGGYMPVTGWNDSGFTYGNLRTGGWFLPIPESMVVPGGTVAGCESTAPPAQALSPLITCVTERTGTQAYTDASPATSPVGAFNHGHSGVDNYSEDGKCMVSGRELPAVIPLTNDKATLTSFFLNATIGGATPGHIGTAWAWYMLSPSWSSVFPSASMPTAYNQPNVIKAALLMTDGEYNIHYASATSRDQALALCTNMKAAGITVYTVGFGFSTSSTPSATGTAEQRAKDLMIQCASPGNKYFFPYDGAQLREDFQNIGNQLMGQMTSTEPKLSN